MPYLEIFIGIGVGIVCFLLYQGVNILPGLLMIAIVTTLYFLTASRSMGKSFVNMGEQKVQRKMDFSDIGGQDSAKNELMEALQFVQDKGIKKMGIRPLKGIMLSGPPGTGKTLLARAAAQYTDSVFLSASGSEFVEMYVGVGAQRVRALFQQAKSLAKKQHKMSAVIFIDEIDVLGARRGQNNSNMEHDQTLNELLVQLDGLEVNDTIKILVIAATNRIEALDEALMRPGRFDRQVKVGLPDKTGRLQILKLHTQNKPLDEEVNLEQIAGDTFGFSGAHLESLANEAAIMALREKSEVITNQHLQLALDKVILGEKMNTCPSKEEKYRIAIHEVGHALLSEISDAGSVAAIHVASRSNALGYVRQSQQEDIYLYTKEYLLTKIQVALAGAKAEEVCLASRSTGATADIQQAAKMARQLIMGGMSTLGFVSPEDLPKADLHKAMVAIFNEQEIVVGELLQQYKAFVIELASRLVEQESISGDEFREKLQLEHKCA